MLVVGLTGGIGCGKSTVTRFFQEWSVPVIDADDIAHAIVQPGQPTLAAIVDTFGPGVLTANGSLDRANLRQLIFHNPTAKATLEKIMHPPIFKSMHHALTLESSPYGILSIPLLFETGHHVNVERILVIDCPEPLQIERVKQRDNLSRSTIDAIMKSQCSREFRLQHTDDFISNDGSLDHLKEDVERLHRHYSRMSTGKNRKYPAK